MAETIAPKLSKNETIKENSAFLRGTILEGLADVITGALSDDDTQLTKFHGIYQQDDRDVRNERRKQKLDKAYSFMARVRVPGGVCTSQQWLEMDRLADTYANGTIKLTTRQAFQFHGIIKSNLKQTIKEINEACLDTIAACGDVNRNVMCNPNPHQSAVHAQVQKLAEDISNHLTPATRAYHEIWLDGDKMASSEEDVEPIYGKTYLPRKFKIVIAVPPSNDVDIFAHDLGYIAIIEDGKIIGYNVTVGGGMGMTHNNSATYPRAADHLGFILPEDAIKIAEAVVTTQRDNGDRADRKHARLKYTVEDMGLDTFRAEVEKRSGVKIQKLRDYTFESTGDRYGWVKGVDEKWHLTLFIQNGRVLDTAEYSMKTALREVAKIHTGDFRLTANQNLIIGAVSDAAKSSVEAILNEHGLMDRLNTSGLRLNSMACVALPTCGLALSESERYLPDLITDIESILDEAGLRDDEIVIRMTGCPNGCARPFLAEIGLVGRSPGKYNLYLGASFTGNRLNKLYRDSATQEQIIAELREILVRYAKERNEGEHFGDFTIRAGYVKAVNVAKTDFWAEN
ncbi:NADPH-dependent assimilatory sulfite reductase hemoprotein subunit [Cerasicoccus arenae]|uniref:Sulfite reductase [NADPH] hemoprotein beta-component n=1 Tax=Cerasicoccus arenae TaxID=424488 RepID=A0A8J3DAH2_9BACT|nr:NADPH-dependent assimilatory sulfite reductase hemoprotein subunit [Cerasicoccus arenae]MBK1857481.1 NADPH-dependent assimilatory sulfite reductase hemoprotein subunit [Cerasicoccus arenae]GHB95278.1 sulfite reductase [NADPH] hemoprotein beta-component [Cerasicoccus arenae]